MSTIANLTIALSADVSGFTSAMSKSAGSITQFRTAAQVVGATRTPLEALTQSTRSLGAMLAKGTIDAQTHARAIALVGDQYRATKKAAEGTGAIGQFGSMAASALGIGSGAAVMMTAVNTAKELAHGIAAIGAEA